MSIRECRRRSRLASRPVGRRLILIGTTSDDPRYRRSIDERAFTKLLDFLTKVPGVAIDDHGADDHGRWWVRLSIDRGCAIAWQLVQEFGFALNGTAPFADDLPTCFKPVSTPPWASGSVDNTSWLIECSDSRFRPGSCADRLDNLFPQPVDDIDAWDNE